MEKKRHPIGNALIAYVALLVLSIVAIIVVMESGAIPENDRGAIGVVILIIDFYSLIGCLGYIAYVIGKKRHPEKFTKKKKEVLPVLQPKPTYTLYTNNMTGVQFERYCALILQKNYGFVKVEFTKTTGDFGGDLIGYHADGSKWVIQCKRYSSHVGNEAVQQVIGARFMYRADRMAVMTNSKLTANAKKLASASGVVVYENMNGTLTTDRP